MTVLVTGGAGYIGSHTVHELVDAGERVVVLDNLSTGFVSALPKPMLPIVGDVGDQALVASLIETHEVDAIIHFAGSTSCRNRFAIRSATTATTPPIPAP